MTECDFDPQTVSVRMEIYFDEASILIASWFGKDFGAAAPTAIVSLATAMLQRGTAEIITRAPAEQKEEPV